MEKTATPVTPAMFSKAPLSTLVEGQTYNTANSNTTVAPNSVQVQNHDSFNHYGNNSVNTNINHDDFGNANDLGEGTNGSNQYFDEILSADDIN